MLSCHRNTCECIFVNGRDSLMKSILDILFGTIEEIRSVKNEKEIFIFCDILC